MGCGASSGTGSHRDAVSAPAATGNGGAKVVAPKKAGSAPLAPVPPVDEGDVNAELLTLGACPGSIFDHYIIGRTLGKGAYATVRAALHTETKKQFAVKVITLDENTRNTLSRVSSRISSKALSAAENDGAELTSEQSTHNQSEEAKAKIKAGRAKANEELKYLCREIQTLKVLDHYALMKLHEYYISPRGSRLYIVMQLLSGGEVTPAIQKRSLGEKESAVRQAMVPVFNGLVYLHGRDILHRDLKLENLLLENEDDLSSCKIADFGMARALFERRHGGTTIASQTICGTPAYIAPEIIQRNQYTSAIDMWSMGVIVYFLLCGHLPFSEKDPEKLFTRIIAGEISLGGSSWAHVSPTAIDFVQHLLVLDPAKRMSAAQALKHPWVTEAAQNGGGGAGGAGGGGRGSSTYSLQVLEQKLLAFAKNIGVQPKVLSEGDVLINQGERCPLVFIIARGSLTLYSESRGAPTGKDVFGKLSAGQYVNEFVLFESEPVEQLDHMQERRPDGPHGLPMAMAKKTTTGPLPPCPMGVQAFEETEIIFLTREQLLAVMENEPEFARTMLNEAEKRLRRLKNMRMAKPSRRGPSDASGHGESASTSPGGA